MFSLLYGSGLRKAELLRLRIKDIDFSSNSIYVFRGKGAKDRITLLPQSLVSPSQTLECANKSTKSCCNENRH